MRLGPENLPVELLYEIQLHALSPTLPHTCKRLYNVYKSAPRSFHAQYISDRVIVKRTPSRSTQTFAEIFSKVLRYPLCSAEIFEVIILRIKTLYFPSGGSPQIPRRLFRTLIRKDRWTERDYPLPFLKLLYTCASRHNLSIRDPNTNSHDGYALTRAVYSGFIPLIQFLLANGADPACNDALAVMVAIRRKELSLVRMLVERVGDYACGEKTDMGTKKNKRRRLEDRVQVNSNMLKAAVKCDARDIVEWLMKEKGCVPDITTLKFIAEHHQ